MTSGAASLTPAKGDGDMGTSHVVGTRLVTLTGQRTDAVGQPGPSGGLLPEETE